MPLRLEAVDANHPNLVALMQGPLVLFAVADSQPSFERNALLQAKPANNATGDWLGDFSRRKQRDDAPVHEYRQGKLQHVRLAQVLKSNHRGRSSCLVPTIRLSASGPPFVAHDSRSFPQRDELVRWNVLVLFVQTIGPVDVEVDRIQILLGQNAAGNRCRSSSWTGSVPPAPVPCLHNAPSLALQSRCGLT